MNMTDMPPIAAVAFLLLAGCASSQPDRHGRVNQFDTNGDGNLSRAEYAESSLSDVMEFDSLDTDGDELLSPSELEFHMGRGGKERRNRGAKGGRPRN
jgi:hypothetical protein